MTSIAALTIVPYLVSLALSIGVLAYTWSRRGVRSAPAFGWYTVGQIIWTVGIIFEMQAPQLQAKILWDSLQWIASAVILVSLPVFVIRYTEARIGPAKSVLGVAFAIPLLMCVLVATDSQHHLIYSSPQLVRGNPFDVLTYDFTMPVIAYSIYGDLVVGASILFLLRQSMHPHNIYRAQSVIIATGIGIPLLGTILALAGLHPTPQRDFTPLTFALGNLLIAWGLYQYRILEVLPIGRDKVFETMVEPVVILDNQHRVVDINTAMLDLLGQGSADVIGKSAKQVFADFPIPIKLYTDVSYARVETTFQLRGKNIHYEMTVWPLFDSNRNITGRVYISHDITAFKELENDLRNLNQRLEQRVHERTREVAEAYDITLEGWAKALELRDKETEGHSRRVTELTLRLARALEIPEHEIVHIRRGAILHDIGKMAIPDEILLKKGKLTDEEQRVIRKHPETAHQFLSQVPFLKRALDIPYCHHEHWDGSGYPRGLKGREIPLSARIFTIADVWDALSSDRPYNRAWPREQITSYFVEQSGKLFDPHLVDVFLKLVEKGEI